MANDNLRSFNLPVEISDPNSTKNPVSENYIFYPEHSKNEYITDLDTNPRRFSYSPFDPFYLATFGLMGSSSERLQAIKDGILQQQSRLIPRPLTRSEHALLRAYHHNALAMISWGQIAGGLLGLSRAYHTSSTQRLPFHTAFQSIFKALRIPDRMNPTLARPMPPGPEVIPSYQKGDKIVEIRLTPFNIVRYLMWVYAGRAVAGMVTNVFAAGYIRNKMTKDERLSEFWKDERKFVASKVNEMKEARQAGQTVSNAPTPGPQSQAAPRPTGKYGDIEEDTQSLGGMMDEAAFLLDDTAPRDTPSPRTDPQYSSTRTKTTSPSPAASSSARPVAQQTEQSYSTPASTSSTTTPQSAWEKIRSGQKPGSTEAIAANRSAWGNRDTETSTTEDSFSYNKDETDAKAAREQAQREFDAKLDEERRGKGGWS